MAQYKLRWPVSDITVVSQDEDVLKAIEELTDIIKDQSNTKDVLCASEFEKLSYNAKPNLKILGTHCRTTRVLHAWCHFPPVQPD